MMFQIPPSIRPDLYFLSDLPLKLFDQVKFLGIHETRQFDDEQEGIPSARKIFINERRKARDAFHATIEERINSQRERYGRFYESLKKDLHVDLKVDIGMQAPAVMLLFIRKMSEIEKFLATLPGEMVFGILMALRNMIKDILNAKIKEAFIDIG